MKAKTAALWQGSFKEGKGTIVAEHSALHSIAYKPYKKADEVSFTDPEELMGAAHISCYNLTLSYILSEAGYEIVELDTSVVVTSKNNVITNSDLTLNAQIKGITEEDFKNLAEKAKEICPVGQVLKAEISLTAKLIV